MAAHEDQGIRTPDPRRRLARENERHVLHAIDVHQQARIDLDDVRFELVEGRPQREVARVKPPRKDGSARRRYAPGSGPLWGTAASPTHADASERKASSVIAGTSTGSATTRSHRAAFKPATRPASGARTSLLSSRRGNGSRRPSAACRTRTARRPLQPPPRELRERLLADPRERLRRTEAGTARSAHQQYTRHVFAGMSHAVVLTWARE